MEIERTDEPPVLSRIATALLRTSRENDRRGAIANNSALSAVIDLAGPLVRACRDANRSTLLKLLSLRSPPKTFLELVTAVLRRIRHQVDEGFHAEGARDFDRHVFQGLADALADFAWPNRNARDFDGPPLDDCCSRLGQCGADELMLRAIQHYLANMLQDYFAAARIRERFRSLDPATESNLRLKDARSLAMYVMRLASRREGDEPASVKIAIALGSALSSTVGGEYEE